VSWNEIEAFKDCVHGELKHIYAHCKGEMLPRDVYRRTVEHEQWKILAKVHRTNEIQNDEAHRKLLFNRCVLQYAYFDADAELKSWYDVHPLITEIKEFNDEL